MKLKLTNRMVGLFLTILLSGIAYSAFSSVKKSEQLWEILDHVVNADTGERKLIVVPKSDQELINCHLSHGDRIYPYDEELARKIIIVQDEGAGYCRQ